MWPGARIGFSSGKSFFSSLMFLASYIFAFLNRSKFPMWSQWLWVRIIDLIYSGSILSEFKSSRSSSSTSLADVSINIGSGSFKR